MEFRVRVRRAGGTDLAPNCAIGRPEVGRRTGPPKKQCIFAFDQPVMSAEATCSTDVVFRVQWFAASGHDGRSGTLGSAGVRDEINDDHV